MTSTWTKDPPTQPGYYWWREGSGRTAKIASLNQAMEFALIGGVLRVVKYLGGEWWPVALEPPGEGT